MTVYKCEFCGMEFSAKTDKRRRFCGFSCSAKSKASARKRIHIGDRFYSLVVVSQKENQRYECLCDCGKHIVVPSSGLLHKTRPYKSCGCMKDPRKYFEKGIAVYVNSTPWDERKKAIGIEDETHASELACILSGKTQRNNASGITGVHRDSRRGQWRAQIQFKHKLLYLGRFDKISDAIDARRKAEELYFKPIVEKFLSGKEDAKREAALL